MYSISLARIARKVLALIACTGAILALTAGPVLAAHKGGITIQNADWDGTTLTTNGKADKPTGQDPGSSVELWNDDGLTPVSLGLANLPNNGNWNFTGAECAESIFAVQDGVESDRFAVNGPGCGGGNQPPVLDNITDKSVVIGGNLTFDVNASDDGLPNGTLTLSTNAASILPLGALFSFTDNGGGNGTFVWNPATPIGTYPGVTFTASDSALTTSQSITITVSNVAPPGTLPNQTDFKILMNYELGMHCTGFEFAYCCVLPVYNSILAQVVKPQNGIKFPTLLEGDPITSGNNPDILGRQIVLRDKAMDGDGNFKKYVLKYWHDAQPRNDGRGKPQATTLISRVEGNSLLSWNTTADAADLNEDGTFKLSGQDGNPLYNGSRGVVLGNGIIGDEGGTFGVPIDNYQNVVWNHLYIWDVSAGGVEGERRCVDTPADLCFTDDDCGTGVCGYSGDDQKKRLGLHVDYPENFGPAGHNMEGLLTYSGDHGTVVYTQMKVLENLPIMLTSPRIWEALGLPLTPFEDTIDFFGDPGLVDEDSIRPYVAMKAQMYNYDPNASDGMGDAVLDGSGNEVIGFGTAPIDIPNCERCHSAPPEKSPGVPNVNSPNDNPSDWAMVQQEMNFWLAFYPGMQTGSDWYANLKGAAVSILARHDTEHGTSFLAAYPGVECTGNPDVITDPSIPCGGLTVGGLPQNTRAGHESVICQKCHADNVIAVVKSASCGPGNTNPFSCDNDGDLIPPLTEAIHYNHRNVSEGGSIVFNDAEGRDGGCQGCHPAHRSDGDMSGYPITLEGDNFYASADNRDANGGCFVGRDVHSNPMKDTDGAETPEHLNPVGQWLADNVASDGKGIWCTNCHQQLGQEMWKAENVADLVKALPGDPGNVRQPDANAPNGGTLAQVAAAVGTTEAQAISWLDPKTTNPTDDTHAIWAPDPGLCDYVAGYFGIDDPDNPGWPYPVNPAHDGNVATVEVNVTSAEACSTGGGTGLIDCGAEITGAPAFHICGSTDKDGDFSVSLVAYGLTGEDGSGMACDPDVDDPCFAQSPFCSTPDCVTAAQGPLPAGSVAVPVPMSAATDGRDHWLSPGEPHCADCHAAPYVEQSGNINAFPPFNYPRKASLMRYSRGHQDITCQGCHESSHGLYPVTPTIDTTSYAQAASLNHDGTHGPLKCGTCHAVGADGIPSWVRSGLEYRGQPVSGDFDTAVSWMHDYTDETSPLDSVCLNCHGVKGTDWDVVSSTNKKWVQHTFRDRTARETMDKVELEVVGHVSGDSNFEDPLTTVCVQCHKDRTNKLSCASSKWKTHLIDGRVAESVYEDVSAQLAGSTCGW
jgi:hypothetical protein